MVYDVAHEYKLDPDVIMKKPSGQVNRMYMLVIAKRDAKAQQQKAQNIWSAG
jgi:hypothetical protein